MTTTADALLQAILERPHDDDPRLILADWLEERDGPGDAARAEFVRLQCEIAWYELPTPMSGRHEALLKRAHELFEDHIHDNWIYRPDGWSVVLHAHKTMATAFREQQWLEQHFRRGFVEEVACKLETWTGGACRQCRGRGTGSIHPPCDHCRGTGRMVGVGATLVACQPVVSVRVTDREPLTYPGGCSWWDAGRKGASAYHPKSELPSVVFSLLTGRMSEKQHYAHYDTGADALAALSSALILLAKGGDA